MLVANQVSHEREKVQLLGRVGRYGQPCRRFRLDTVDPLVNETSAQKYRQGIHDRLEALRADGEAEVKDGEEEEEEEEGEEEAVEQVEETETKNDGR